MTVAGHRPRFGAQSGSIVFGQLPLVAAALVVALVVTVDVGAYLHAASRAQSAADGAALAAAVAAHPRDTAGLDPARAAADQVAGTDVAIVRCDCRRGARHVEVVTRAPVAGLLLARVWAPTVDATAVAQATWVVP